MELKAEPGMAENLNADRMAFWDRMVWQEMEWKVELQQLYSQTVNFLEEHHISVV